MQRALALVLVLIVPACFYDYEGGYIVMIEAKNCSGSELVVEVNEDARGYVIPPQSTRSIKYGDQCDQCGSDYSCWRTAITVKNKKGFEMAAASAGDSSSYCPSETKTHPVSVTCDGENCLIDGEISSQKFTPKSEKKPSC